MGLWGAAQAIAFGLGGFLGTVAIDVTRVIWDLPEMAYGIVFCGEGVMFLIAAVLAARVGHTPPAVSELGHGKASPMPATS